MYITHFEYRKVLCTAPFTFQECGGIPLGIAEVSTTNYPLHPNLSSDKDDSPTDKFFEGPPPSPLSQQEHQEREAMCREIILSIRRDEFGYGLELLPQQEVIAKKQREREGRSLKRLSQELYSKDTHFVLELVQNADDNSYPPHLSSTSAAREVPALKFILSLNCVVVLNNEVGFSENNIRAICDVGKSTKGSNRSGYIGQKGIGFKSVFRVTDTPEIHSSGFHIKFDTQSGPIGYILPHWVEQSYIEGNIDDEELRGYVTYKTPAHLINVLCHTDGPQGLFCR